MSNSEDELDRRIARFKERLRQRPKLDVDAEEERQRQEGERLRLEYLQRINARKESAV